MSANDLASAAIPLGKGWHNKGSAIAAANYGGISYEGTVRSWAEDSGPSNAGNNMNTFRSHRPVTRVLVRNVSGGNLLPKRVVTWKTGYVGKRVDGYVCETAGVVAGVVDEYWPASGVPDGELFWLVVKGPTLVKTSLAGGAENVIAALAHLHGLTAATSGATTSGRVEATANALAVGTVFGRALSAKTTGNTDADLLAEIDTWIG